MAKKEYTPLPEGTTNGRISKDERAWIEAHCKLIPADEIATKLGRNKRTIEKVIKEINSPLRVAPSHEFMREIAEFDIRKSPIWKELVKQFNEDELELFLYHWKEISLQFKNDILHTERMQIVDMARYEIMMNRCLERIKIIMDDVNRITKEIQEEEKLDFALQDKDKILGLTRLRSDCNAAMNHISSEHKNLMERKQSLLKETKGTREQRIKRIESTGENMVSWITKLIENPDLRKKLGIDMEKMRLATEVEVKRLSEFHKYEDGMIDQPFLNCDTVE